MALISINPISAFDAYAEQTVTFSYSGSQCVKNRLIVYENDSNAVVYDNELPTLKLSQVIPANTLTNDKSYSCTITAYDIENNSVTSSKVFFTCFTTPIWEFENLTPNQIVKNSSYVFNIKYFQAQGELLNEYKVTVYSSGKSVFWDSGVMFDTSLSAAVNGLADNTLYFLRATGRTVNGMSVDTGFIPFSVEYQAFALYSVLTLENIALEGQVKVSSNIVVINGKSIPDDPVYIDDSMIDLRSDGTSVVFDEGFNIDGNYLLKLAGRDFTQNCCLLELGESSENPAVYWRKAVQNGKMHAFAELRIKTRFPYVLYSNFILEPKDTEMIQIWIRRIAGLYELKIEKK